MCVCVWPHLRALVVAVRRADDPGLRHGAPVLARAVKNAHATVRIVKEPLDRDLGPEPMAAKHAPKGAATNQVAKGQLGQINLPEGRAVGSARRIQVSR
jgi:hypothetical protein